MDFLDKYKYHKDDPREFGVELKDLKKASSELDNSHLSNLLTNSVSGLIATTSAFNVCIFYLLAALLTADTQLNESILAYLQGYFIACL